VYYNVTMQGMQAVAMQPAFDGPQDNGSGSGSSSGKAAYF